MNFLYILEKIVKRKLNAKRRKNRKINIKKKMKMKYYIKEILKKICIIIFYTNLYISIYKNH